MHIPLWLLIVGPAAFLAVIYGLYRVVRIVIGFCEALSFFASIGGAFMDTMINRK